MSLNNQYISYTHTHTHTLSLTHTHTHTLGGICVIGETSDQADTLEWPLGPD